MKTAFALLLTSLMALGALTARAQEGQTLRRYALIIGANDGGAARVRLRYAESDATALDRVLRELGGVAESDRLILLSPSRAQLQGALDRVRGMLSAGHAPGLTTELLVYYSGHSDDRGLMLKEEILSYDELRQALNGLSADVRIAILDSCASGELTRSKGGQRKPAFLTDSSSKVKGHAFLTSSTADEVAQESDRIGSSFFTHALISGLRGAADSTGDSRVTLNEAYQFAFNETLARTEQTIGGPQHPSYDIQLVGSGDLVMTDLRGTSAGLHLTRTVAGRISIRDDGGRLVVELDKQSGHPMDLALEPGRYQILLEKDGRRARTSVALADGKREVFDGSQMETVATEVATARGAAPETYLDVPFSLGLVYLGVPHKTTHHFELNLLTGGATRLHGATVSSLGTWFDEEAIGLQLSGVFNREGTRLVGADVAGVANLAGADVTGTQLAGVANVAAGPVTGAQLAGVANVAGGSVSGAQLSGVANIAGGPMVGAQLSGVVNVSLGGSGVWASGVGNVRSGTGSGLGMAGVFDWQQGDFTGAQLTGVFAFASKLKGAQLSVINIGGEISGAQIGVINVANSATTQIGVLNFANEAEATAGLLSITTKGTFHVGAWFGDAAPINAGVKLGGRKVYTVITAAYDPRPTTPQFSTYFGVGVHMPVVGKLWIDPDFGTGTAVSHIESMFTDPNGLLSKVRLNVGYSFFDHFAVVAGVSLNVLVRFQDSTMNDLAYGWAWRNSGSPTKVSIWPSPYIGLEI